MTIAHTIFDHKQGNKTIKITWNNNGMIGFYKFKNPGAGESKFTGENLEDSVSLKPSELKRILAGENLSIDERILTTWISPVEVEIRKIKKRDTFSMRLRRSTVEKVIEMGRIARMSLFGLAIMSAGQSPLTPCFDGHQPECICRAILYPGISILKDQE